MTNNDILKRVRYALSINDAALIDIFKLAGYDMTQEELTSLLKRDDEPGFNPCNDKIIECFLDGLIYSRRGRKEDEQDRDKAPSTKMTNNTKLKKLRIALELKEEDLLEIMALSDIKVSKSELTALFRKEGHKNYKTCGDQFLRNFIKGLTIKHRSLPLLKKE